MSGISRLTSSQIPQADKPEQILALAQHLATHRDQDWPEEFNENRHRSYYLGALQLLGALDASRNPAPLLFQLSEGGEHARQAFRGAFAQSAVGQAWLNWSIASELDELNEADSLAFLQDCSELAETTAARRATTLRRWLHWCKGSFLAENERTTLQLNLFAPPDVATPKTVSWPAPERFPHNESGARVRDTIAEDLEGDDVLLVVGYSSLDEIIRLIGKRFGKSQGRTRLLFGNEPFGKAKKLLRPARARLADEIRDYWLERGVSVLLSADILRVREAVMAGEVEARIAPSERGIHAKIYASSVAVTLGSSNFTYNGLAGQSEANARFCASDERFDEARALGEGFWQRGLNYQDEFLKLLDTLLRAVTWQEALARGCAEILEGHWAKQYVPPEELEALNPPMWPHQLQGLSQAIWTLYNLGSVLVSDATGSGKTRMGAWLLRAAHDRQIRYGFERRVQPVLVSPPAIVESWERQLQEAGIRWRVDSHGPLSNSHSRKHELLLDAIENTELLAIDEAHNFINTSGRTKRMQQHYADNVVLFTATPINRGATDLLGIVELLGADNFPDDALETLRGLQRMRRWGITPEVERSHEEIRREIRKFLVRRTRSDLNAIAEAHPASYRLPTGRNARYPRHNAEYYPLDAPGEDMELASRIVALADQLQGVTRIGKRLELPAPLAFEGMNEAAYLQRLLSASAALARHFVVDCLRSSRVALFEHIHGTDAAIAQLAPDIKLGNKQKSGNTIETLRLLAGNPPVWAFERLAKEDSPAWVWSRDAHAAACAEEEAIYSEIASLVLQLSDTRERQKVELLTRLSQARGMVIGFDSHVLSLGVFEEGLRRAGVPVESFTGAHGVQGKRRAMDALGLGADNRQLVALCSDALSEGMNLQAASVVVHLDTPTVIRTAEQRAGRVDRMDSPHDTVEIWWPKDPPPFAPRGRDLLRERHEVVADLIGANLQMPSETEGEQGDLTIEDIAKNANLERQEADPQGFLDAFKPVRDLVEGPRHLVPPLIYEAMRTSQADVIACVCVVQSERPWAYLAVGGVRRIAPRWVYMDSPDAEPIADLAKAADALRANLNPAPEDHALDNKATEVLGTFVRRLEERQQELLPIRRQRALKLAERVIPFWINAARAEGDQERVRLLGEIRQYFSVSSAQTWTPDLRAVADAWLDVIRPTQRQFFETRRRSRQLWRLEDLEKPLREAPLPTHMLRRAFDNIPLLPPLSERIVAAIIGVPADKC